MTPCTAAGESPFSLVYGLVYVVDVVIPIDIGIPNLRTKLAWPSKAVNDQMMTKNLKLLGEKRNKAFVHLAHYH